MKIQNTNQQGFSLVELAVVLVLIGIVMTMGLKVATSTLEGSAYSDTKSKQELIKAALVGFLRTNGRLPCPDNSAGVASGVEATSCNANIADGYGVVPWMTLGISRETVIDGWGNYFTYRVANGSTASLRNWTSKSSGSFNINELHNPTNAFTIQELDATGGAFAATATTTKAVVVLLSHGRNGFGAKTTKVGARLPTSDAGAGEATNATDTTLIFVLRPVTDAAAAFNGPYDDLLMFMTPQDLFQPLLNEGSLKSCYAYCPYVPSCTTGGTFSCAPSGNGYCLGGGGVACTAAGSPTCTAGGAPICVVSGPGCTATGIPVGTATATCS